MSGNGGYRTSVATPNRDDVARAETRVRVAGRRRLLDELIAAAGRLESAMLDFGRALVGRARA